MWVSASFRQAISIGTGVKRYSRQLVGYILPNVNNFLAALSLDIKFTGEVPSMQNDLEWAKTYSKLFPTKWPTHSIDRLEEDSMLRSYT